MKLDSSNHRKLLAGLVIFIIALIGCGGITMKTFGTAEEQYREAFKEYQKKHYLKAIDGFQKVIYNFSGASMVDSAQYFLAMSYYEQDDYFLAAAEFERLVNNYPGSRFVDDGQYMAGLCFYKSSPGSYGLDQDELKRAIGALEDFVTDNPESELADDAQAAIKDAKERLAKKRYENGRMYFRLKYYDAAGIYFQTVIDEHTDSKWAARALYFMGEIEYNQKRYPEAKSKLDNFLVVYPDHEFAEKARKKLAKIEKNLAKVSEDN
jgi:outer membrane protein assembly factor BamD